MISFTAEKIFAECLKVAGDPNQILVTHMWENHKGYYLAQEGRTVRRKEVTDVLAVIAGKSEAYYNDEGFFLHDGFPNRVLRGNPAGFVSLATSPVTLSNLPIFPNGADTGLLLKNPIPVFVSHKDSWTVYYERLEDIPAQEAWDIKCDKTGIYPKSDVKLSHSLLRDDAIARRQMAGKLCVFRTEIVRKYNKGYPRRINDIIAIQMLEKHPFLLLDPHDSQVHERAKAAYRRMLEMLVPIAGQLHTEQYPEADVNAKLEHAVGILVYNRGTPLSDPDNLQDNILLAASLYQAFSEYDQLLAAFEENAIDRVPIIVIYQPGCQQAPLLHFMPASENRKIIAFALKKNGYELDVKY